MKISLGPILYFWPKNKVQDFYAQLVDAPVDIFYLGETVCYKRNELRLRDLLDIAHKLTAQGKEVVLSTLALLEAAAELHAVRKVCENGEFMVEANDIAAVHLLSKESVPFVAGPSINTYNSQTLNYFTKLGMQRWVMPVELGRDTLQQMLAECEPDSKPETEVFTYGKLPLAYSARCFTARAHNLPKDRCELKCLHYPDGLTLKSQEQQSLFTINGIQTQSGDTYDLRPQWQDMANSGVDILRISPDANTTAETIEELHNSMQNNSSIQASVTESCNGYWFGQSGLDKILTQE